MLKLYRIQRGVPVAYHEAWVDGDQIIEHWGTLGERGETSDHPLDRRKNEEQNLKQILQRAIAEGFKPIELDDHAVLSIEYIVDGMGSPAELEKRHALEDRMNETLGWTGLGACDGGSIGSGTMEIFCFVVDFETARRVIEQDLAGTAFAGYSRIHDINED